MPNSTPGRILEEELLFGEATATLAGLTEDIGILRKDLASRLNLSPGRISQILSGKENLTLRSQAALGWSMGVRFHLQPVAIDNKEGSPAENDPALPHWLDEVTAQVQCSFRRIADTDQSGMKFEAKQKLCVIDGDLRDVAA